MSLYEIPTFSTLSKRTPTDPPESTKLEMLTLSELTTIIGESYFPLKTDFTILRIFNGLFTLIDTSE